MAQWFDQLRATLRDYYPQDGSANIVGYLRGSPDPNVWRIMKFQQERHQMIILGSTPPTKEEWSAAGVGNRGETQTIRLNDLDGFIVMYAGFVLRPWGRIEELSAELLRTYSNTLSSFERNRPKPTAPR
jgi:hypothetical protein